MPLACLQEEMQRQSEVGGRRGGRHDRNAADPEGGRELIGIRFQSSRLVLGGHCSGQATAVTTETSNAVQDMLSPVCHLFSHFSHWLTSQALFTAQGRIKNSLRLSGLSGFGWDEGIRWSRPLGRLGLIFKVMYRMPQ